MTDLQPENASMVQTFCMALHNLWDQARGKSGLSMVVVVVVVVVGSSSEPNRAQLSTIEGERQYNELRKNALRVTDFLII
jgi:hypothetical protein